MEAFVRKVFYRSGISPNVRGHACIRLHVQGWSVRCSMRWRCTHALPACENHATGVASPQGTYLPACIHPAHTTWGDNSIPAARAEAEQVMVGAGEGGEG